MIPILILAAGASRRMEGRDKLLEEVRGLPLLRRQVIAALETGCPVYVALPDTTHPRAAVIAGLDARLLGLYEACEGLSGTLRGAVAALPACPAFMVFPADLVDLEASDLTTVLDAYRTHPDHLIWRGATQDGQPGHPIIFDATLRPRFADLHGDTGGARIVQSLHDRTHLVNLPGQRARLDLDTPQDWAAWRAVHP